MLNYKLICLIIYRLAICFFLSTSLLLTGCADLTQAKLTPLDNSILIQPNCICHKGHLFAIRGFLGIWSRGMNTISARAQNELHIPSTTIGSVERYRLTAFLIKSYKEGYLCSPIILVGHSLGSDDIIEVAWSLYAKGIPVYLLAMTDPVMPRRIPPNVVRCYNVYKCHPKTDFIPIYRGVTVKAINSSKTIVENINIRGMYFDNDTITHFNIEKAHPVQNMILNAVRRTMQECP